MTAKVETQKPLKQIKWNKTFVHEHSFMYINAMKQKIKVMACLTFLIISFIIV